MVHIDPELEARVVVRDADDSDGDEGDAANGTMRLSGIPDHAGGFDLHLPMPLDENDREALRDRIAAAVEHHAANGGRGDLPGAWLRDSGLLEPPRIPWQRLLHRFLDEALSKDDYSRTRPNKRYLAHDLLVPGLVGQRVERIVVAIDSSGSITKQQLISAVSEVTAVVPHSEEIVVIVADAAIHAVVDSDGFAELARRGKLPGGGGTDHRPVFAHVAAEQLHPTLFIGITDLESAFPPKAPPYPVLWITPERHGPAPWGQVIVMPD